MPSQSKSSEKFIPSLDGWRAVAIFLVFASHAGLGKIVPGGLGVTIFFFLSGYLITTLTCREFDQDQKISIKHFYARRALRLLPPLLVTLVLAYTLAYAGVIHGGHTLQGFFAQLLYFANYYVSAP
jgi:peptidoglycan/LPS O-acetylase OafA/YrhL